LRGLFKELKPDATVLEASDAARTLQLLADQPDVALILLDLSLPDRDGFALLTEVRERYPGISVVVLSGFPDRANVLRALDRGALGFIPKSAGRDVMMSASTWCSPAASMSPGDPRFPQAARDGAIAAASQRCCKAACIAGRPGIDRNGRSMCWRLMMQGKSNRRSAACSISPNHGEEPCHRILKALRVSNRTEAVLAASALGWEFNARRAGAD